MIYKCSYAKFHEFTASLQGVAVKILVRMYVEINNEMIFGRLSYPLGVSRNIVARRLGYYRAR